MADSGYLDEFWRALDSLERRRASRSRALRRLESGRRDDGVERGWTLRLDVDDELVAFCPECDRKEFGD
jgi:hypothetical protein